MKLRSVLIIFSIIFFSCNQTNNIIGNWNVSSWAGDSYSVLNLKADTTKNQFDEFVYTLLTERNAKLVFNKESTFAFDGNSIKHFEGKFEYYKDSSLNLIIDNRSLNFSILNDTKDSILLFVPYLEQIQARNLKLKIIR